MKNYPLKTIIVLFLSSYMLQAQYYVPSRKNKALLVSNAYSLSEVPVLTNSIEIGRKFSGVFLHSGIGMSNLIDRKTKNVELPASTSSNPIFLGILGLDLNLINFQLLNLSHKSYCKYLIGGINIGWDIFKNLQTPASRDYGYRAKANVSFCIYRTGSHKKDIGYRRFIELGYAFSDDDLSSKTNNTSHTLLVNFLIVKQRLIKFANWY